MGINRIQNKYQNKMRDKSWKKLFRQLLPVEMKCVRKVCWNIIPQPLRLVGAPHLPWPQSFLIGKTALRTLPSSGLFEFRVFLLDCLSTKANWPHFSCFLHIEGRGWIHTFPEGISTYGDIMNSNRNSISARHFHNSNHYPLLHSVSRGNKAHYQMLRIYIYIQFSFPIYFLSPHIEAVNLK